MIQLEILFHVTFGHWRHDDHHKSGYAISVFEAKEITNRNLPRICVAANKLNNMSMRQPFQHCKFFLEI